jgi:Family of unknown function (DUF5819)
MLKYFYKTLKAIAIMWLVIHISLTIIYNMPMNPLKLSLNPLLNATIGTFFGQNWSLFAPNPVGEDYILLVQPRSKLLSKDSSKIDTIWYNTSSTLWLRFQKNRFSAYDRLARNQSNATRNVLNGSAGLVPVYDACRKGDTTACRVYEESLKNVRKYQTDKLALIASAFVNDIKKTTDNFTHIGIRIRIKSFSPWSKRYLKEVIIRDIDLGEFKYNSNVAPIGIYE